MIEIEFKRMTGFHKIENLWKIEYELKTLQPFITQSAYREASEEIEVMLRKEIPKDLDFVPLVVDDRAIITGNSIKGLFRHIISAQLTQAGQEVCVQEVKLESTRPEGRKEQCKPDNPCFVCTWFGTASRQGALHFSFLKSVEKIENILLASPIPMIAMRDDYKALKAKRGKGAFALIAPVKEGVVFKGWIKGENLSDEIIGAIKEIQEWSKRGFLQLGGLKTRGFGAVEMKINRIERYKASPLELERAYEGNELESFLRECHNAYKKLLKK